MDFIISTFFLSLSPLNSGFLSKKFWKIPSHLVTKESLTFSESSALIAQKLHSWPKVPIKIGLFFFCKKDSSPKKSPSSTSIFDTRCYSCSSLFSRFHSSFYTCKKSFSSNLSSSSPSSIKKKSVVWKSSSSSTKSLSYSKSAYFYI